MDEDNTWIEYLSVGANRHTAVADWSQDGLVAFGADSNIALWRPHDSQPRGVTSLLSGHKDTVKAIKFLSRSEGEGEGAQHRTYLLSGADDHCLKIWSLSRDGVTECIQTLQEHTASVNCIATVYERKGRRRSDSSTATIFATGAADASIKIWAFDGREARVVQTINPKPKFFPLAIALSRLDESGEALVLAAAGTRDIVQIFVVESIANPEFQLQATLTGHEGWIRSLDFTWEKDNEGDGMGSDLLLASASQDKYIRLWRLHQGKELPAAVANGADPSLGAYLPGKSPSNKAHRLNTGGKDYTVTFEALLLGHDDWIYSAKWYTSTETGRLQLLSASADNTLAIWEADPSSGIWVTNVRLGEISREKGATTATGSTGGFWTGLWSPDGMSVTCLGRTGCWRVWNYNKDEDQWTPQIGISGHTRAVTGIAWAKNGDYLLSTGADQTTRLHASWKRDNNSTWHEMARPQIHGYDLNCIDSLGSSQFVSGADEKLMRVFDEPKAVAKLLGRLCGINDSSTAVDAMPDAANMPVLGLSNKAIEAIDDDAEISTSANPETDREALDPGTTVRKSALEIDHPPFEDSLSRHTLWPETEKLYGHGYEISCLAVSHAGDLIASACKASSVNHAVIRIFETRRWTEIKPPLTAHSLTATRLRFSPDDRYILSVGRDRQWAVFEREEQGVPKNGDEGDNTAPEDAAPSYKILQANPKGHTRMILDAAWAPSQPQVSFATAGRDKSVKLWRRGEGETEFACAATIAETHSVTAVDFHPRPDKDGRFVLAVGTEIGKISIHILDPRSLTAVSSFTLRAELCLAKPVLQLSWRPQTDSSELAVAGDDSSLRIYRISDDEK
ncbi:WD40-repeat-containing domain protein [Xylaria bambusicola]|uniref:WD40-repeat-containing domain protein n=1 Tax=Xylaria bambusicola TaxID=326684 RepID=UPI0020087F2B|nr:WD40-repeat-containing domain protein [Xylaria bambusicola]KAI0514404.1 WD40-repeat-containing domain protein [Xylaria bambusicola]